MIYINAAAHSLSLFACLPQSWAALVSGVRETYEDLSPMEDGIRAYLNDDECELLQSGDMTKNEVAALVELGAGTLTMKFLQYLEEETASFKSGVHLAEALRQARAAVTHGTEMGRQRLYAFITEEPGRSQLLKPLPPRPKTPKPVKPKEGEARPGSGTGAAESAKGKPKADAADSNDNDSNNSASNGATDAAGADEDERENQPAPPTAEELQAAAIKEHERLHPGEARDHMLHAGVWCVFIVGATCSCRCMFVLETNRYSTFQSALRHATRSFCCC